MLVYLGYLGVQKLKKRSANKALEAGDGDSTPKPEFHVEEPLRLPVAVPQIHGGLGVPFTRAYSPALLPYGISEPEFLEFIDNLSIQANPNPALQAMTAAGAVIGFVPYHWAIISGTVMSLSAKAGSTLLAKRTTEDYVKDWNASFFAPRKLKVSICKGGELATRIGMPEDAPLVLPVTDRHITGQERRLAAVQPWISPLTMGVSAPAEQTTYSMSKISAKQVAWKLKRKEKKTAKQKDKFHQNAGDIPTQTVDEGEVLTEAQLQTLNENSIRVFYEHSSQEDSDSEQESSTKSKNVDNEREHEVRDADGTTALLRNMTTEEESIRGQLRSEIPANRANLAPEPEAKLSKEERKEAKKAQKELKKAKKVMWILIERLEEDEGSESQGVPVTTSDDSTVPLNRHEPATTEQGLYNTKSA